MAAARRRKNTAQRPAWLYCIHAKSPLPPHAVRLVKQKVLAVSPLSLFGPVKTRTLVANARNSRSWSMPVTIKQRFWGVLDHSPPVSTLTLVANSYAAFRAAKGEQRVFARGVHANHSPSRTTFRAAAVARCCRWVLASPR